MPGVRIELDDYVLSLVLITVISLSKCYSDILSWAEEREF